MKPFAFWTPTKSLGVFFASAVGWFLLTTLVWMQVSNWASYPTAGLAHVVLDNGAKYWVRKVIKAPGHFEVETRIQVAMPDSVKKERGSAELVAEAMQ